MNLNRKLKSKPNVFGADRAKRRVLFHLGIAVRHRLVCVSDPEANQVLGHTALPQARHTESAEGMKTARLFTYRFQNRMQAAVSDIRVRQRLTAERLKQKPCLPFSDLRFQHCGERGMHVNFPETTEGLWTLHNAIPNALPHTDNAFRDVR